MTRVVRGSSSKATVAVDTLSCEVSTQFKDASHKTGATEKYDQKLKEKLQEAEVFAAMGQRASKDLKNILVGLTPQVVEHPIFSQKLVTVLEMVEGRLQLGEEVGIALKKLNLCTDRSELLIRQAETTLEEIDSLLIYLEKPKEEKSPTDDYHKQATSHSLNRTLLFSDSAALAALKSLREQLKEELKVCQKPTETLVVPEAPKGNSGPI